MLKRKTPCCSHGLFGNAVWSTVAFGKSVRKKSFEPLNTVRSEVLCNKPNKKKNEIFENRLKSFAYFLMSKSSKAFSTHADRVNYLKHTSDYRNFKTNTTDHVYVSVFTCRLNLRLLLLFLLVVRCRPRLSKPFRFARRSEIETRHRRPATGVQVGTAPAYFPADRADAYRRVETRSSFKTS